MRSLPLPVHRAVRTFLAGGLDAKRAGTHWRIITQGQILKSKMFPYEIVDLEEPLNEELMKNFTGERSGFCRVGPKGFLLPAAYRQHAEQYYTMPVREDDIWIITFPRSGTTWCQELVWLLNNNLDYEAAALLALDDRFPFNEFSILQHEDFQKEVLSKNNNDPKVEKILALWRTPGYEFLPKFKTPRHIKTHLPFSLLPPDLTQVAKSIYVARNPEDVAASYFHHNSLLNLHGYVGDFKQYWDYFERDLLVYSPYFEHIKEGWSKRNEPNVLFLFYEDLILDLPGNIRKVASFLNKPLFDEHVDRLVKHLHMDNFKKAVKVHEEIPLEGMVNNNFSTGFFRKGGIGGIGGNTEYDEELRKKVNAHISKHLADCDIKFPSKK